MKNKLPIIISVIAVIIPVILIPVLYKAKPAEVINEPAKISKVTVTDSAGSTFEITDDEEIAFYADLAKGTAVTGVPDAAFSFKSFIFRYYRGSTVAEYRFYMSAEMPDAVYFLDNDDSAYKADPLLCRTFMNTAYAITLYDTSAPTLCVGSDRTEIAPREIQWNYSTIDGSYSPVETATSAEVRKIENISKQTLNISFSREPSSTIITVENGDDAVSRLISDFQGIDTEESRYFRIKIEAKWNESESESSYGSATYVFDAYIRADAAYTVSSDTVDQGGVIGIRAVNANAADISVTCDPPTGPVPVFRDNGGCAVAFIATSFDTEPGDYKLTLVCDGVTSVIEFTVTELQYNSKTYTNSSDEISRYFSETNKSAMQNMLDTVFGSSTSRASLCPDEDFGLPTYRDTHKTGYGITMTLKATGETFRHNGIDYHVKKGTNVCACMSGQIVYVGRTSLNGGVIVIDHGNGVRTWYSRVDTSRVSAGQTVAKGAVIAVSDDSGFGDSERVHLGVSFDGTFVSPLWMLEHGIPYINE